MPFSNENKPVVVSDVKDTIILKQFTTCIIYSSFVIQLCLMSKIQ